MVSKHEFLDVRNTIQKGVLNRVGRAGTTD